LKKLYLLEEDDMSKIREHISYILGLTFDATHDFVSQGHALVLIEERAKALEKILHNEE
jgi:hypothetical protein